MRGGLGLHHLALDFYDYDLLVRVVLNADADECWEVSCCSVSDEMMMMMMMMMMRTRTSL